MPQHFFDLHCHPIVKTLFKNKPQISPWVNIVINDKILGNALESQCSLRMLFAQKNINLICMAVCPLEMGLMHQLLLYVAGRIPPFKKYMQTKRLQEIADATIDYQQELREELENLMISAPLDLPGKKIKVLKSFKEYNENDFDTLHIIFTLEGAHTYYEHPGNKNDNLKNMLQNFCNFMQLGNLVLFAGLTHLTPNVFCTHAYGNKILSKGRLMPRGYGITDFGKTLIEEIDNNYILIDIKHTSWVARTSFIS
jgi:microsomal dipeptidase-like Zn-dependent dipeptidase